MTALIRVHLRCDFPACRETFEPPSAYVDSLPAARRVAAAKGWTSKPFGRKPKLAYDYCPAHPDGKEKP